MKYDIFISYSRDDKSLVHPFAEYISKSVSRNCWIDLKGIESGTEFEDVIMKAIDECQVVLFMLSDNSLKSKWTKREVLYAEDEGKRIVPVLVDGDKLRGWFKFHFSNVDYIDIKSEEQKEKLVANLKSWLAIGEENSNAENSEIKETGEIASNTVGGDIIEENNIEEVIVPSDVFKEDLNKVSKINEITNVISNLWNKSQALYKWLLFSVLLFIIAFQFIFKGCQSVLSTNDVESMIKIRHEMSQRLTEAIASNDARALREFAITHDSTRAYMPYVQICLDQENFDTADSLAVKLDDNALKSIIQQKRDSFAQVTQQIAREHVFDSLFNVSDLQYRNSQYDAAKGTIAQMDDECRSRQEVQLLLSRIEVAIAKNLNEAKFDSLYNIAKSQYDSKQFKTAKETLGKMDSEYQFRQKVKDLLKVIEKAITPSNDEVYQQALKSKDWPTIEKLANKGYSKAYYQLAQWYFSKKNYTSAKKWANKAVKAGVSVKESKKIVNQILEEESLATGSKLYQQWVTSGDSLKREKAIQFLIKADQNNQLVKNMLNELKKERKHNPLLH